MIGRLVLALVPALTFARTLPLVAQPGAVAARQFCSLAPGTPAPDSIARPLPPLVATPAPVRGVYVNRWAAIDARLNALMASTARTEINALVIDVKDDRGFVLYSSRVALARAIGADTNRPLRFDRLQAALATMRAKGIYPIARIVVAKDPLLAAAHPEWTIRARADSTRPWLDRHGSLWLDPHQDAPWRYAAELACEAVALGFSEIQLDYVRFPEDARLDRDAAFALAHGRSRAQVIRDQLVITTERLKALRVPVTADVFGLTTTDTSGMSIGQRWELIVGAVDVVQPMMYPSHYWPGSYGFANPNAHPSAVITRGLRDAKRRTAGVPGAALIRPWYQDFTLGAPRYGAAEVRAQIEAGYAEGILSWLLWNPRSVYSWGAMEARAGEKR